MIYLIALLLSFSSTVFSSKAPKTDVKSIDVLDLLSDDDVSNDYSARKGNGKQVVLNHENTAVLYQRAPLFSRGMKVESCTGIKKCAKHRIDKKLTNQLKRCNFEGRIQGDPDSKVTLVNCEKGASDISIVSDRANLDNTHYRVHVNGTLEKGRQPSMEEETSETAGDYTLGNRKNEEKLTYVNKKGDIMTLEMMGPICCRPIKKTCNKGKDCVKKKGKKLCNRKNRSRKSKIKTCTDLKKHFKKKLKKKVSPVYVMKKSTTTLNPKCKRMFREGKLSNVEEDEPLLRPLLCHNEMCRSKERIPDKRIYKERTLEFGIVVDKYLFDEMKSLANINDDDKVEDALIRMLHSLMVQVETYLTHRSFSSKKGGFRIKINGVQIYK